MSGKIVILYENNSELLKVMKIALFMNSKNDSGQDPVLI